jgi:hypothetical protein
MIRFSAAKVVVFLQITKPHNKFAIIIQKIDIKVSHWFSRKNKSRKILRLYISMLSDLAP